MFRDGFLRFCDDPDLACCRAEKELGKLRIENGQLYAKIEKLQAQLESLRCTSCGEIPATIGTDDGQYCEKCAEELDAVEMIDLFNYHNPADVEALRKAKEAISAWDTVNWCDCDRCKNMRDALAAIDKIGGREDV